MKLSQLLLTRLEAGLDEAFIVSHPAEVLRLGSVL
jgi:hypothetical protein